MEHIKRFNEDKKMKITKDIPVIDRYVLPKDIQKSLRNISLEGEYPNGYFILYLRDDTRETRDDYNYDMNLVTDFLRENGITSDSVLIDNTW